MGSSLLLLSGVLLSLAALPLASFRTSRQPLVSSGLEERVLAACERFPSLAAVSGLSEGDFTSAALRSRFRALPAAPPSPSAPPRSALSLALALREESRERGEGRVYVGAASPAAGAQDASWRRPPLSPGRIMLALAFGVSAGSAAAGAGSLSHQLLLLLFGAAAAALSLVDVDTLLVDLPLLSLLSLLALLALLPPVSGLTGADAVRMLGLPLFAAAGLSAAGSSALLLRRSRARRSLLLSFLLLFSALLLSLSVPYLLALVALLEGRPLSLPVQALSALPLLLTAFLGRRMLLSSSLVPSPSGPQLAPGPSSGIGDGDLLLLFPALLLPAAFGGFSAALSSLLLSPLLLLLLLPFRRLLMPGPSSVSAPLPFGPPLLLAPLLLLSPLMSGALL